MISITKMGKTVDEAKSAALQELGLTESEVEIEVLEEPKSGLFGFLGAKDAVIRVTATGTEKKMMDAISHLKDEAVQKLTEDITSKKPVKKVEAVEENFSTYVSTEENEKERKITHEDKTNFSKDIETIGEFVDGDYLDKAAEFLHNLIHAMGIEAKIDCEEDEESLRLNIVEVDECDAGVLIGKRGETLDALQYLTSIVTNAHTDHYVRVFLNTQGYREKREIALKNLARKMANKAIRYGRNMKLEPMNPYERRIIHSEVQKIRGVTSFSEGSEPYRRLIIQPERTRD